ncbi:MAG TPA: hypothetical protein VNV17_12465 [Solirubrobacteraceae bacterium]|jgi:hypothetical protein|nr:hypothetical protein [Solirubrobacteraceae bacterium]
MSARRPAPPSGMAPPVTATLPDGVVLELRPLAGEITERHLHRHPEDVERYGDLAREWGIHDNQHLVNWAVLDVRGVLSFPEQLRWLANVLDGRGYPLANLADNLQTGAEVIRERVTSDHTTALADTLEAGAELVGA